ncbi:MAG: hypothetical protein KKG59_00740 [Nanoarchaeota archaeon]|nr:hypothetical protein [Nanoarchaeota archaeon]
MKKLLICIFVLMFLTTSVLADNPGAIWTTKGDCGEEQQDVNEYAIGEAVFINGNNFDEGTEDWGIEGQPGGASCDPNIVVANGEVIISQTGAFCFEAYTVAEDDCGVYKVKVGNKQDTYHIEDNIPEFTSIGLVLGLLGSIAVLFGLRKK